MSGTSKPRWKASGERAPRRGQQKRDFEPHLYRDALWGALCAVDAWCAEHPGQALPGEVMHRVLRRFPRGKTGFFSRSQLVRGLQFFGDALKLESPRDVLIQRLTMRPTRSQSGVAPVTVFTRPHPCPGQCVFCPNDVRMPKSYLSDEPGAQRAEDHRFDPYRQTLARLAVYRQLGHTTDKVELIILGGTWSFYPLPYRQWFVLRCFQAMNDFDESSAAAPGEPDPLFLRLPRQLDGRTLSLRYNEWVARALREAHGAELLADYEHADEQALREAHALNERAGARCVGLVVETRPDHVTESELLHLRMLGVTKVQLGIQSVDDRVLALNKRGHDTAATRRALALLRSAGFKIHAHFMPNLLGSDPVRDRQGYERLFSDPGLRPDELKVYPCSLIESAELMQHYERGEFRPYDDAELESLLEHVLRTTPRYCRLTRVIRDISSDDIVVGNRRTNLREIVERRLLTQGVVLSDIRAREVRTGDIDPETLVLEETRYATSVGQEVFLEWLTSEGRVAAFLRLSLPREASFVKELGDAAVVRELHVYGRALSIGARREGPVQHRGLGGSLLARAAELAREAGHTRLSVISAVGTRDYYERRGFVRGPSYQHLDLKTAPAGEPGSGPHWEPHARCTASD